MFWIMHKINFISYECQEETTKKRSIKPKPIWNQNPGSKKSGQKYEYQKNLVVRKFATLG